MNVLGDEALNQLFREARTYNAWLDRPVTDDMLRQVYDLMKWGPPAPTEARRGLSLSARRRLKRDYVQFLRRGT